MNNFLAVGNDELGQRVKKGDIVQREELIGKVEYGTDGETGKESEKLGFIKVEDNLYLVSIDNQLLRGWTKYDS